MTWYNGDPWYNRRTISGIDPMERKISNAERRITAVGEPIPGDSLSPLDYLFKALTFISDKEGQALGYLTGNREAKTMKDAVQAILGDLSVSEKPLVDFNVGGIHIAPSLASIGGTAAEILNPLDPINWLTFGLGKAGLKAGIEGVKTLEGAVKAGELAADAAKAAKAAKPYRALQVGVKAPWMKEASMVEPGRWVPEALRDSFNEGTGRVGKLITDSPAWQAVGKAFSTDFVGKGVPANVAVRNIHAAQQGVGSISDQLYHGTRAALSGESAELSDATRVFLDTTPQAGSLPGAQVFRAVNTERKLMESGTRALVSEQVSAYHSLLDGLSKPDVSQLMGMMASHRDPTKLAEPLQDIGDKILRLQDNLTRAQVDAGMPLLPIDRYVPFIVARPATKEDMAIIADYFGVPKELADDDMMKMFEMNEETLETFRRSNPHLRSRKTNAFNPEEVNNLLRAAGRNPLFQEDLALVLSKQSERAITSMQFKKFFDAVRDTYGLDPSDAFRAFRGKVPEGWGMYRTVTKGNLTRFIEATAEDFINVPGGATDATAAKVVGAVDNVAPSVVGGETPGAATPATSGVAELPVQEVVAPVDLRAPLHKTLLGSFDLKPLTALHHESAQVAGLADEVLAVLHANPEATPKELRAKLKELIATAADKFPAILHKTQKGVYGQERILRRVAKFAEEHADELAPKVQGAPGPLAQSGESLRQVIERITYSTTTDDVMGDTARDIRRFTQAVEKLAQGVGTDSEALRKALGEFIADLTPMDYTGIPHMTKGAEIVDQIVDFVQKNGVPAQAAEKAVGGAVPGVANATDSAEKAVSEAVTKAPDELSGAPVTSKTPQSGGETVAQLPGDSFFMPREFIEHLNSYADATVDNYTDIGRMYHWWLSTFKASITVPPGYWVRNKMGDLWNMWLGGFRDLRVMVAGKQFLDVVDNPEALAKFSMALPSGKTYSGQQLANFMRQYGLMEGGIYSTAENVVAGLPLVGRGMDRMQKIGRKLVDDHSRASYFFDRLLKGADPLKAATETKKVLFDYFDLTPFERKVMKQIVPFYTWWRKNLPYQLESLVKHPGKFATAAKYEQVTQGQDAEQQPEWIRAMAGVLMPGAEGSRQYLLPNLPYQDLNSLNLPDIMGRTNPLARLMYELSMNKSAQTGIPIVKRGDNKLLTQAGYAARQLSPLAGQVSRGWPSAENTRATANLISMLTGVSTYPEEKAVNSYQYDRLEQLLDVIARLKNQGVDVPDATTLNSGPRWR